jgi:hypothetical protein
MRKNKMSHFYGTLIGKSGKPVTREGTKNSGLFVEANTWENGIKVEARYDKDAKETHFYIYQTGGSKKVKNDRLIETIAVRG